MGRQKPSDRVSTNCSFPASGAAALKASIPLVSSQTSAIISRTAKSSQTAIAAYVA